MDIFTTKSEVTVQLEKDVKPVDSSRGDKILGTLMQNIDLHNKNMDVPSRLSLKRKSNLWWINYWIYNSISL